MSEIQNIVTALERPLTNEKIEELNQKLQMYLEEAHASQRVLNLSFWETVRYQYWSFINLTLLIGSKFDVEHGDVLKKFENKIREIQRLRLISDTPKVARQILSVKPSASNTLQEPLTNVTQPSTSNDSQYFQAIQSGSEGLVIGNNVSQIGPATFVSDGVEMTVPVDNILDQSMNNPCTISSNNSHSTDRSNIPLILGCSCIIGLVAWYVFRNFNVTNTQ